MNDKYEQSEGLYLEKCSALRLVNDEGTVDDLLGFAVWEGTPQGHSFWQAAADGYELEYGYRKLIKLTDEHRKMIEDMLDAEEASP